MIAENYHIFLPSKLISAYSLTSESMLFRYQKLNSSNNDILFFTKSESREQIQGTGSVVNN